MCLVEDPATKRRQPRNYLETLQDRVAQLETILQRSNEMQVPQVPQKANGYITVESPLNAGGPQRSISAQGSKDIDDVGDLEAKVGMLSVAAGSEPHYLGQSSAIAFVRVINSSLLKAIPSKPKISVVHDPQGPDHLAAPCLLPDSSSCIKLSNAYFEHLHTQYPFLHEPTFRQWEADIMPSESIDLFSANQNSLCFLYMVCSP